MKIEATTLQTIKLTDLDKLDPVTVTLDDQGPGKGGITLACYGRAWTAWWGGMGKQRIAEFFISCSSDYLHDKLSVLASAKDRKYLLRIIEAAQSGLREWCSASTNPLEK